jgi:hypothetical protein
VADLLLTDHPANGVNDITFSAAVWSYNSGNVLIEIDSGFISKGFKAFDV